MLSKAMLSKAMSSERPSEGGTAERCFVDTNVFLRYLTDDVPAQADAVDVLLARAEAGVVELVTTPLAVAEVVWTLESYYGLAKEAVAERVLALLNTPGLEVEDADLLTQAAVWYAEKNVDFIDAYHGAWMRARGLAGAYTFDGKHFGRFGHVEIRPFEGGAP